jgi:hypothetical protein
MARPGIRLVLFLGLLLPALVPVVCPFPPFQDWPGHLGIVGVLLHESDSATRVAEYYRFSGWLNPNILEYGIMYVLGQVLPGRAAGSLFLAAALGGLGLATRYLLRGLGPESQPRLALVATPLALGRLTFCGFSANVVALAFWLLALGAYGRLRRVSSALNWLILGGALVLLSLAHTFVAISGICFLGLFALVDWFQGRDARTAVFVLIGCLLTGTIATAPFLVTENAGEQRWHLNQMALLIGGSLGVTPVRDLLPTFWHALFAFYRYRIIDDVIQAIWLFVAVTLGVLVGLDRRPRESMDWGNVLLVGVAVALVAFCILPENLGDPVNWWGVNIRVPTMLMLLLIPAVAGRSPASLLWKNLTTVWIATSVLAVCLSLADLAAFNFKEMTGFAEVIQAMPPGRRISFLHYSPDYVHEYPGEPYGYIGNYYVLEKGGATVQTLFGNPHEPVKLRVPPGPAPGWGYAAGFDWQQHADNFDGFVVRGSAEGGNQPFDGHVGADLKLRAATGFWRYYERGR